MAMRSFKPIPAVKVDNIDLLALNVEYPDTDVPAMVQALNGKPIFTDRILLGNPDDRMRFAGEVIGRSQIPLNPLNLDSGLQRLCADLQARVASLPPPQPAPPEPPWPKLLDDAALHGLAGDVVRTIAPHTEADPAAILIQFVVAFGNVIGCGPHAIVERTRHGLNEYCCLVGDTAKARKGTSSDHIMGLFRSVEEGRLARGTYTIGDWMGRHTSGLATGEGVIWSVRDPIMKREPVKQQGQIVGYQEVEADPGVADKRLMVMEGELAAALKVLSRDGNTLSPVLRNAWDGVPLRIMTKNFPAKATAPHVSIVGHITKDELRRDLAAVEGANGFANRFIWLCVRRSKELPDGGNLTEQDLGPLVQRLDAAMSHAATVRQMQRDQDASRVWHRVYHDLSAGKPGLLGAVTARAEAHVLRLSCLYALLDHSDTVREPHLLAALALWQYAEDSARHIFGDKTGNPLADELFDALLGAPTGLTRDEIGQDVFNHNRSAAEVMCALDDLVKAGKARVDRNKPPSGRGRPTERWYAVTT